MNEENRETLITSRLREARRLAGLSQGQVAKLLNMHRPTISEIEAGNRRVSVTELVAFAEVYDVSVSFLMGEGPSELSPNDPKLQLAARELSKLSPDALQSLMRALAVFRVDETKKTGDNDDGKT